VTHPCDPLVLLADMLAAPAEIEAFAAIGEGAFLADLRTRRAVERSFETLGEAANLLPAEVRERFSEVPWRVVIDHRNRLSHGYATIDSSRVWRTHRGRPAAAAHPTRSHRDTPEGREARLTP
jgi:uncharacterized protein with HEPN domain